METGREGAQRELWVGVCEQGRTSASIYPVHSHQGFPKRELETEKSGWNIGLGQFLCRTKRESRGIVISTGEGTNGGRAA